MDEKKYLSNKGEWNKSGPYESGWFFSWYIDASHSGGCKDETEKFIKENGGDGEFYDTFSEGTLSYFDRDAFLRLNIFTSCTAS